MLALLCNCRCQPPFTVVNCSWTPCSKPMRSPRNDDNTGWKRLRGSTSNSNTKLPVPISNGKQFIFLFYSKDTTKHSSFDLGILTDTDREGELSSTTVLQHRAQAQELSSLDTENLSTQFQSGTSIAFFQSCVASYTQIVAIVPTPNQWGASDLHDLRTKSRKSEKTCFVSLRRIRWWTLE